ncbi:MAG: glycosyltransferase [Candidatus Orphnella occulta]|nr:glycosyltransferase [Candidatus Orphnella occulta]
MNNQRLTIVIPAHNEEASLPATTISLESIVAIDYDIAVMNDHSADKTANVAREFSDKFSNLRMVENDTEPSLTSAIKKVFQEPEERCL